MSEPRLGDADRSASRTPIRHHYPLEENDDDMTRPLSPPRHQLSVANRSESRVRHQHPLSEEPLSAERSGSILDRSESRVRHLPFTPAGDPTAAFVFASSRTRSRTSEKKARLRAGTPHRSRSSETSRPASVSLAEGDASAEEDEEDDDLGIDDDRGIPEGDERQQQHEEQTEELSPQQSLLAEDVAGSDSRMEEEAAASSPSAAMTTSLRLRHRAPESSRLQQQQPGEEEEEEEDDDDGEKAPKESAVLLPFFRYVLCYQATIATIGALLVFFFEVGRNGNNNDDDDDDDDDADDGDRITFFRCFFLCCSTLTGSGLNTINVLCLSTASLTVLALLALLGSSPLLSLIPVLVRRVYLSRAIPLDLRTFDLSNFDRVPFWVVEYKCLVLLTRLVVAYQVLFMACGALALWSLSATLIDGPLEGREEGRGGDVGGGCGGAASPLGFAAFTSIMAFTNAGVSLRPVWRGGGADPALLPLVGALCLAGNTFWPILLRWTIIFMNKLARDDSSRKVYFRYLLINGRQHYPRLFTSQETWLLLAVQVLFLIFQSLCLVHMGTDVNRNQAVFESINTRHAGFTAVRLEEQNAGILVLFLVMMFLAPTPFVVVLHRTETDEGAGGGSGSGENGHDGSSGYGGRWGRAGRDRRRAESNAIAADVLLRASVSASSAVAAVASSPLAAADSEYANAAEGT
jgi:hypothetical protein